MNYLEYKPCSFLSSYIDHYAVKSYGLIPSNPNSYFVPDCMTELVFNFGKEYKRKTIKEADFISISGSHLIGIKSMAHQSIENTEMDTISVRFRPGRLSFFTKVPMNELTDSAVQAIEVFGHEILKIEDKLKMAKANPDKIAIIETFLLNRLLTDTKRNEAIEIMSSMYKNPTVPKLISTLITKMMYYKKLERFFSVIIGITPKLAERVIRINYAIQYKMKNNSVSLTELAQIAGYFDQSHFIKDFVNLANQNPNMFFQNIRTVDTINITSISRQFHL